MKKIGLLVAITALLLCFPKSTVRAGNIDIPVKGKSCLSSLAVSSYPMAYPNPFRGETSIFYKAEKDETIALRLFTKDGKLIDVIYSGKVEKETINRFELDGKYMPPGVYYYSIENGEKIVHKRLELVR